MPRQIDCRAIVVRLVNTAFRAPVRQGSLIACAAIALGCGHTVFDRLRSPATRSEASHSESHFPSESGQGFPNAARIRKSIFPPVPPVESPGAISTAALQEVAKSIEPGVFNIGHPPYDSGTAFVISRMHRLLATNAHVVEPEQPGAELIAIRSGTREWYKVTNVWYHPDYKECKRSGTAVWSDVEWRPFYGGLAPDVAVIQLAPGGSPLEHELKLAKRGQSQGVEARPAAMMGFSGPWPTAGRPMRATFRVGIVRLLTRFRALLAGAQEWCMMDLTTECGEGDSGAPIFLEDGKVVAVSAWGRQTLDGEDKCIEETAAGVGVDALWELLERHSLLEMVPSY